MLNARGPLGGLYHVVVLNPKSVAPPFPAPESGGSALPEPQTSTCMYNLPVENVRDRLLAALHGNPGQS